MEDTSNSLLGYCPWAPHPAAWKGQPVPAWEGHSHSGLGGKGELTTVTIDFKVDRPVNKMSSSLPLPLS